MKKSNTKRRDIMYDLKKVEEKFHEYLSSRLNSEVYRVGEIRITEDLIKHEKAFYIWFGSLSYFLVIEDERPVVYAHARSRMDLDVIAFIDENGFKDYDVWDGDHPEIVERYRSHARNVEKFDYDDLQFISDAR